MSIPTLKLHDNGVWYIHWTDGRRSKRESTGAKEVAEAKAYLGQWLLMDREAPIAASDVTVSELWELYHNGHIAKNVTSKRTASYAWANLKHYFGYMTIAKITHSEIENYAAKRGAGAIGHPSKSSTVRRELVALRACLRWCADSDRNIISAADLPKFDRLPSESDPRERWLTKAEIGKILAAAKSRGPFTTPVERLLWLALNTAARVQALIDLTWDRVDFETGMIHYDVPGRKKTKKRRASVPMSKALAAFMQRAWFEAPRNAAGELLDSRVVGIGDRHYAYNAIRALTVKAGIERAGPNAMRHTAATHMVRGGTSLHYAAKVLGNTYAVTEKHYAKHVPDGLAEAVNTIPGVVEEAAE